MVTKKGAHTNSPNRNIFGWAEPKRYSVGYGQNGLPTPKSTRNQLFVHRFVYVLEVARRPGGRARLAPSHPEGFPPPPFNYTADSRSPEMERQSN